jgi:hypothetical protein
MPAVTVKVVANYYSGFVEPPGFGKSGSEDIEAGEGTFGVDKSMPIVVDDIRREGRYILRLCE